MPKVSKDSAGQGGDFGLVIHKFEDVGDQTVTFLTFREDVDHTPLLRGLPGDQCQCPHWGYVVKGRLTFRFADHDEVFEAGDAFYTPPGHIPVSTEPGSEYVQFSPIDELRRTSEVIERNLAEMQAAEPLSS